MAAIVRGIDFGTSTSLLAESTASDAEIVDLGRDNPWIPSIVGMDTGRWHVGEDAADLAEGQILRSVKRAITENSEIVELSNGREGVLVAADDAIKSILRTIGDRAAAEFAALDEEDVVVRLGCPAMWTGEQRRRLIRLANEAGIPLGDSTLVDEPIAAGVAWIARRLRDGVPTKGKVLVFDMGGGTLDVAVMVVDARPGHETSVSVQAASGRAEAGDALDRALVEVIKLKLNEVDMDVSTNEFSRELDGWLLRAARQAKVELGEALDVPVITHHPTIEVPVVRLQREELADAFRDQMDRAIELVWAVARAALMSQVKSATEVKSLSPLEARRLGDHEVAMGVDFVLLAGGMTRVPEVRYRLGAIFGDERLYLEKDPTTTIARGLGEDRAYESLNLHRPGFDFVIEWVDEETGETRSAPVYRAYSPLYDSFQVFYTNSVKYEWRDRLRELPTSGQGRLRVRSVSDEPIGLVIDGHPVDGVPFRFARNSPYITLEPNGRVFVRDSFGATSELIIERWPVIKGKGYESIKIRTHDLSASAREWWYDISGD